MKRRVVAAILSVVGTLVYLALTFLVYLEAVMGPCGSAPGDWCESHQKSWLETVDGYPYIVLIVAGAMYVAVVYLILLKFISHNRKTK